MKKLFSALAITLAAIAAQASYEVIQLSSSSDQTVLEPGKIVRVEIVSSVASGTATVKRASPVITVGDHVDTYTTTNFTYTTVWSNGTEVVTNTTPYRTRRFTVPPISYTTNLVVSSYSITNAIPGSAAALTNSVTEEITCSSGYGSASPSDKWVLPGDRLFYSGTATGVKLIIER